MLIFMVFYKKKQWLIAKKFAIL